MRDVKPVYRGGQQNGRWFFFDKQTNEFLGSCDLVEYNDGLREAEQTPIKKATN